MVVARLRELNPDTQRPHTTRDVARWLEAEHKIHVGHTTVGRLRIAAERLSDTQVVAAIREELREAIAPTKAKLFRAARHLDTLVRKSKSTKDVAAGLNAYTRMLHELATLSGVAAPAQVDVTSAGSPLNFYLPAKRDDGDASNGGGPG